MAPHQEPDDRDAETGTGDEGITENTLAREAGHQFANHAHARKNHDVNGGVRIEPEHVLEQDRIAADSGVENADMEGSLQAHQRESNGDDRSAENLDERG